GDKQKPRQDNLSPVKYVPENLIISTGSNNSVSDNMSTQKSSPLNQILFGPPGTGKTFHSIHKAVAIANPKFDLSQSRDELKKEFDNLMKAGQIVFTTFHQSMSYEDFVEGIKPLTVDDKVIYNIQPGIFKQLCQSAS